MDGWGISFPFVPDWKIKRFQPLLLTKSEFIKQKIKSSSMEETDYSLVRSAHAGLKESNFWVWGIIQKGIHSGNPDSSTKVLCRLNKAPLCSVRALCYMLGFLFWQALLKLKQSFTTGLFLIKFIIDTDFQTFYCLLFGLKRDGQKQNSCC